MPVPVSLVRICLQRRETIHPDADNLAKRHLGAPRRDTTDVVGKEQLLFRCASGKEAERVIAMDLPFVLFIPFGRGGEETNRRIPPASLQLPSRTAETFYELVVTVQQGHSNQYKYSFPIPLQRYDTLSTFGMYNKPESKLVTSDSIIHLGINLPRWSYGPSDPITVYIKLSPNQDWLTKAKRVTIDKITLTIEEEITYNPEGDEPSKKVNKLSRQVQAVKTRMPEAGYATNVGLCFPSKDLRDPEGVIKRGKPHFPLYEVASFTTSSTLYKIEFYLSIKVRSPLAIIFLADSLGPTEWCSRRSPPPAYRHLPSGSTRMQGRNGRDRAGCQRRLSCRPKQPHASGTISHPGQRPRLITCSGPVYGGRPEETLY